MQLVNSMQASRRVWLHACIFLHLKQPYSCMFMSQLLLIALA